MFYSISNCQAGLKGVSFGNFLIKQVAEELKRELPSLRTFITLSPVPGFREWLQRSREGAAPAFLRANDRRALESIDRPGWAGDADALKRVRPVLQAAVAGHQLATPLDLVVQQARDVAVFTDQRIRRGFLAV